MNKSQKQTLFQKSLVIIINLFLVYIFYYIYAHKDETHRTQNARDRWNDIVDGDSAKQTQNMAENIAIEQLKGL